jgi:hypothetical protein
MRSKNIKDREQQGLCPLEPFRRRSVGAERDQLIEPRHQQPGTIRPKPKHLSWISEVSLHESLSVEPIGERRRVLAEHLIDQEVTIEIERRSRDPARS